MFPYPSFSFPICYLPIYTYPSLFFASLPYYLYSILLPIILELLEYTGITWKKYLETLPGNITWKHYLEKLPGKITWKNYLEKTTWKK